MRHCLPSKIFQDMIITPEWRHFRLWHLEWILLVLKHAKPKASSADVSVKFNCSFEWKNKRKSENPGCPNQCVSTLIKFQNSLIVELLPPAYLTTFQVNKYMRPTWSEVSQNLMPSALLVYCHVMDDIRLKWFYRLKKMDSRSSLKNS